MSVSRSPWSAAEVRELKRLIDAGHSPAEAAKAMRRTLASVTGQAGRRRWGWKASGAAPLPQSHIPAPTVRRFSWDDPA